uniref:c-type cytochrome n=1 Tax=Thiolapillus sp. TaxID=2017437 RepID=UPI003AF98478
MASDAYLYWTIGEGGTPVGSAMPPFKDVLSEEEISRIMLYPGFLVYRTGQQFNDVLTLRSLPAMESEAKAGRPQ